MMRLFFNEYSFATIFVEYSHTYISWCIIIIYIYLGGFSPLAIAPLNRLVDISLLDINSWQHTKTKFSYLLLWFPQTVFHNNIFMNW